VGGYVAFETTNNSMNNGKVGSMPMGTIVLGKQISKTEFKKKIKKEGTLYWIIVCESTIMCKEITAFDSKDKKLTCHSLNSSPEFPDFEIGLDEVKQFFLILKKQVD